MSEFEHCQVLGPFNSGTVLMDLCLRQLFRNHDPDRFPYWKHSLPPRYEHGVNLRIVEGDAADEFPGVLFVCMVRSPYFWLPATSRRPYDFHFHARTFDMSQRLRSALYLRRELFTNLVDVWNRYYRRYALHLEPLGRVIYVRMEDLVRNPRDIIERLEEKLERKPGSDVEDTIDGVLKEPRKSDNAFGETWQERNHLDFVKQTLRNEDLSFINQHLDPQLMQKFGYPWAWAAPL